MVDVRELGVREYADAWAEMRALRAERRAGRIPDTLLLLEHPAVITVGVQGSEGDELPPDLPVHRVERGGRSTYHGPGQLVGYALIDLEARGRDVRRFVTDLESVVIDAVRPLGIDAGTVAGKRGVWVGGERKLASVGVAVEEWVTFHGFALNVGTDLGVFQRFRPCGFDGAVMTSMARELNRPVSVAELIPGIATAFRVRFASSSVPPPGRVAPTAG